MKLLVNEPTGRQAVIEVGEGGGYFDITRVLWDERNDGPLPEITLGGMVREGTSLVFNQQRMNESVAATLPQVPQQVTMRQARLALLQAGLYTTVNSTIANLTGDVGDAARIEWEYSQTVQRRYPLIETLSSLLNLSDEQLDALFIQAAQL